MAKTFEVFVRGNGEAVTEGYDTEAQALEGFNKACDLIDEGTYEYAELIIDGQTVEWAEQEPEDYDDDYDECGFDPYAGCYTYDC